MELVYKYGLLAPVEGADLVKDQLLKACRYRNKLVEIERARRATLRDAVSKIADMPRLEAESKQAKQEAMDAHAAIKKEKARTRSNKVPPELREAYKLAKAKASEALKALKAAQAQARNDPGVKLAQDMAAEQYGVAQREARAASGCYWGTYLLVEAASRASFAQPLWDSGVPNDPHFTRWTHEGRIGVQLQGGMDVSLLEGEDQRVRLEPRPPRPGAKGDPKSMRSAKRRYLTLALRVGSDESRNPIWARFPLVMHRPLPRGATIKWVTVSLREIGTRQEWTCHITLSIPGCLGRTAESGVVAIDLGWRRTETGLRVAAWRDDQGKEGFLVLPYWVLDGFTKADSLRSIRDRNFDAVKAQLLALRQEGKVNPPDWFAEATSTLHLWKSQQRLARLVNRWAQDRFDGDEEMFPIAKAWRKQENHLWDWEASQRLGEARNRRDIYSRFAADLVRRYKTVVMENVDLRRLAKSKPVDDESDDRKIARHMRVLSAPHTLRDRVKHAFLRRGGEVFLFPAAYTTMDCHACNARHVWNQADEVVHRCEGCGVEWDQDINAAKNLLQMYYDKGDDVLPLGTPTTEKSEKATGGDRWAMARKKAAERRERLSQASMVSG